MQINKSFVTKLKSQLEAASNVTDQERQLKELKDKIEGNREIRKINRDK